MAFQNRKVNVKVAAALGKFNRRPRRVEGRCRAVEGAFGTCKGGGAAVKKSRRDEIRIASQFIGW